MSEKVSKLLTLDRLMAETEIDVPLPTRAAALLGCDAIRLKAIDGSRFRALFPLIPQEVLEGDPKGIAERERLWIEQADSETRIAYRLEIEAVKFRALALASLSPRLTYEQAERLGDDMLPVYHALLIFSGLLPSATSNGNGAKAPEGDRVHAESMA